MVIKSNAFNFQETVSKFMMKYGALCADAIDQGIREVARDTVRMLRNDSAALFGNGDYAKGWTVKFYTGRYHLDATVYGKKPTAQLAHLLEFGHLTRNGIREYPDSPAKPHPHIAKVNDWAQDEAVDRILEKLDKLL